MSESEKTIIFESNKRYPPGSTTNNLWFVFREGAKFGYQLGYEQAMKQVVEKTASAVYIASKVAMASKSNEPSQDELWEEMFRVDEEEGTQEAKKRYRITRI